MNYINQLIITIFQIPMILIELYRLCGFWGIGSLFTLNITEIAKFQIGRLRPHFIAACNITLNEALCFEPFPNATDVIEGSGDSGGVGRRAGGSVPLEEINQIN